jgi:CBS domain-containing protein
MERYGQDFNRNRWGGMGGESGRGGERSGQGEYGGEYGWRGGGFENRGGERGEEFGGRGRFGGGRGSRGGYGREFGERGGEWGGRQGGYGESGWFGGGMGQRGDVGQRGGGRGGEMMGSGYGGFGYSGRSDVLGEQRGGYGGGFERGWGREGGGEDEQSRLRAAEIMTENPETVMPDATLADAARKMRDLNVGIIPVVESSENRRLRGVITDRDIAVRAVAEGLDISKTKVADVMTTEVETCNKNDLVHDILQVMEREQVRRVPITDREGRLVGIVAQADVAVDYMGERQQGKREVARALRRISEPAEPERTSAMAARGRGAATGGHKKGTRASQVRGEE